MLKLPNSIEPAVMSENIVHLRDGLAAVDAKTLPSTTSATTGQILKLTGENKTPAWADEYSYTPPAYSETEVNTGQKWIDGKDIYCKVFTGTMPELQTSQNVTVVSDFDCDNLISFGIMVSNSSGSYKSWNRFTNVYNAFIKTIDITSVSATYSEGPYYCIIYYTKPDPVPGDAKGPEDSDQEQEPKEKKTTKKKTTK